MKNINAYRRSSVALSSALAVAGFASGEEIVPRAPVPPVPPLPPPFVRVIDLRADEKPVDVEKSEAVVEENAFFRRVRTTFTFTNPNQRVMSGEFEFPIPEGASVCGYSLQIGSEMVPGVVCEKEKARVAFENETKKGVDPGIVEQVKGNIWKTRIFPLNPKTPRKAEVDYVAPKAEGAAAVVYERDGDDIFAATPSVDAAKPAETIQSKIASFTKGTIIWDASMSAKPFAAAWRKKLEALPEKGEWALVVFDYSVWSFAITYGFTKDSLLKEIDRIDYDGGTNIGAALEMLGGDDADCPRPALLFTDEVDTMGLESPKYEEMSGITVASRDDVQARPMEVRRLAKDEKVPDGAEVKEGRLLATVWAARRMQDLASQSDSRKDEFLALGRKYGVAGPGLSLIVLETLEQWLEHKIEPPANLAIHDEWVRRRSAEDDPIAEKKAKAEHEQQLLQYWEERVKWWNDPKPQKKTPKSGLFDTVGRASGGRGNRSRAAASISFDEGPVAHEEVANVEMMSPAMGAPGPAPARMAMASGAAKSSAPGAAGSGTAPTVTLKAWDPKAPYIKALKAASKDKAYKVYLEEREKYAGSPAFFLDCAGWFYKAGDRYHAERILSNLAEFKLEDAALWRSMGWRAREAGSYGLAILAFRKALALRGEEAQSRRDLALVLAEHGKEMIAGGDWKKLREEVLLRYNSSPIEKHFDFHVDVAKTELEEAMKLFADAAFHVRARRSGRRGNDFQVSVIALEELNGLISWVNAVKWPDGLISWVNAVKWPDGKKPAIPEFDAAYRRDLPVKLRIVMSWDADETDIDLHVLEPNGEEAFYGNRRTAEGGFVSEDVTTGYGPEEYLKKDLESGVYKILSNYFASHQAALTGATTVTATVYTDWGTAQEKRQVLTLRLDKPKDKHLIGEVSL